MSQVFPRSMKSNYPVAVAGDGCYIIDSEGKRYLDGSGGAAVSCLGHSHPAVIEAVTSQIGSMAFAHTGFFTSEPAEKLASLLVAHAPVGIEHAYFVSGGSEAVEAALKLARQYFVEIGQSQRHHVIARRQSYHGNTLGRWQQVAMPGDGRYMIPYSLKPVIYPPDAYREMRDGESETAFTHRVADELEIEILDLAQKM